MRLIRHGQRSAAVHDLQTRLERLGSPIAPPERGGSFGASTEQAVRAFQQQRGLDVDGIVGEATWRELVESSWALGDRVLSLREPPMRGDDVRELQDRLNALGFPAGKHDGIFGPTTASALREFQRDLAIQEDGILGRESMLALERMRLVTRAGLGPRIREREARREGPPGLAGKRIAIDPGHGGGDPGEARPGDLSEADLAFALSARLARWLDGHGAHTMLTRGPHHGASEGDRSARANEFQAHLLVSIHLNAWPTESAEGATTYFFEHGGIASEPGEHLARLIQSELVAIGRLDCRSHGKSYPILRDTRMPAVVVEPCFLTNPAEAKLLSDPSFLELLTRSIGSAVFSYFAGG